MSLAWSLRGQFGHLKGALIPGAAAAAIVILLHREELWRKAFGWAVLLSALGFSLGGHLSYGALINKILISKEVGPLLIYFLELFLKGAVWGGLGMSFLGFSLQETSFTPSDLMLLAFLGLFWFIPLGVLDRETLDLSLYGTGLLIMHLYNFFFKKSRVMALFGASGIFGFGLAFVLAVFILYLGKNGSLGSGWPWWHLRDQIIGAVGGFAVVTALHRSMHFNLFPNPQVVTLTTQRGGFVFFTVIIPAIQTLATFEYWIFKQSIPFTWLGYFSGLCLFLLFTTLLIFFSKADERFLSERGLDHVLFFSIMVFIWFLSGIAIFKEILPFGFGRWEPAHTLFLVASSLLTLFIPLKVYRKAQY